MGAVEGKTWLVFDLLLFLPSTYTWVMYTHRKRCECSARHCVDNMLQNDTEGGKRKNVTSSTSLFYRPRLARPSVELRQENSSAQRHPRHVINVLVEKKLTHSTYFVY